LLLTVQLTNGAYNFQHVCMPKGAHSEHTICDCQHFFSHLINNISTSYDMTEFCRVYYAIGFVVYTMQLA